MSIDSLWLALEATFSSDRPTRQAAEEYLASGGDSGAATKGNWCAQLLDFAASTGPSPINAQGLASDTDVRVAAAVFLKNAVSQKEWMNDQAFAPAVRQAMRDRLIAALCTVSVADRVRRVLMSLLEHLHSFDWPSGRWPELLPATFGALEGALTTFDALAPAFVDHIATQMAEAPFGSCADAVAPGSQELANTLRVVAACAQVIKLCCKAFDDPASVETAALDRNAAELAPPLGAIATRVANPKWLSAMRTLCRATALLEPSLPQSKEEACIQHVGATQHEVAYSVLKSLWYLAGSRIPPALADAAYFNGMLSTIAALWLHCNESLYDFRSGTITCVSGMAITTDDVNSSAERGKSVYFWKLYKRAASLSHRWLQLTIIPKQLESRLRELGAMFVAQVAPNLIELALETMSLHRNRAFEADPLGVARFDERYPALDNAMHGSEVAEAITSKAFIMSVELVNVATGDSGLYGRIHSCAAPLLTDVLFERLSITPSERELWADNPIDFVRRLTDPRDDYWNSKIVAASLVVRLCIPAKKFQDATLIAGFAQHVQAVLTTAPQAVVEAPAADLEPGTTAWAAALQLDACLHSMVELKKAMSNAWPIASVLETYVAPLLESRVGFLRARAVHVLAAFLPIVEWPSGASYHAILGRVMPLLRDPEVPVRIRTAMACSGFIRHHLAYDAVAPHVGTIITDLLDVVKVMDSESVVHAMRRIIKHYAATVASWAVPLAAALIEHFKTLHVSIAQKTAEQEERAAGRVSAANDRDQDRNNDEDEIADAIAAADELLATLATLTKAIPNGEGSESLFLQLQQCIAPLLTVLLSGSHNMGFMDIALRLLTRLVQRSSAVIAVTWETFTALHRVIVEDNAVDYFGQLISPIDNFVSVDPTTFVSASATCGDAEVDASPAGLLLNMCRCVLAQAARLRRREVLPAFAITDIAFVNALQANIEPAHAALFARRFCAPFASLSAQYYADLAQRGRASPQPAEWAIMTTAYMGTVLYATRTLDWPQVVELFPLDQLFYVTASIGELSSTAVNLRVYDRKVFTAAVLGLIRCHTEHGGASDNSEIATSLASALRTAVCMTLQTSAIEASAVRAAVRKAQKYEGKQQKSKHRDPQAALDDFTSDDSDIDGSDGSGSSSAGDDDDDDDDEDDLNADDLLEDGDDEGSERDEDDKIIRSYDHFTSTIAAARKLAAKEAGLLDDDEDDEDELAEDHLEDTDFTSPIDNFDEYTGIAEVLFGNSGACEAVRAVAAEFMSVPNALPESLTPTDAVASLTKGGAAAVAIVHSADCNGGVAFGGDPASADTVVALSDLLAAARSQRGFLKEHSIVVRR